MCYFAFLNSVSGPATASWSAMYLYSYIIKQASKLSYKLIELNNLYISR